MKNILCPIYINMYIHTHICMYIWIIFTSIFWNWRWHIYQNTFSLYRLFSLVVLLCTSAFFSLGPQRCRQIINVNFSLPFSSLESLCILLERALGINTSCSWSLYSWWLLIGKTYFLMMHFYSISKPAVFLLQRKSLLMWDLFLFLLRECILWLKKKKKILSLVL